MTKIQLNEYEFIEMQGSELMKQEIFSFLIRQEKAKLTREMPTAFQFVRLAIEEKIRQRIYRLMAVKEQYKISEPKEQPYVYYTFSLGTWQVSLNITDSSERLVIEVFKRMVKEIKEWKQNEIKEQEKAYVNFHMLQKAIDKRMEQLI